VIAPCTVHADARAAISAFSPPPHLHFGQTIAPVLFQVDYSDGHWGNAELRVYGPIQLDPAAKVLHYAQVVFEGLKAYRVAQQRAQIFRPTMNWRRMNASARRMLMPELPEDLFMQGLFAMVAACEPIIPRASGQSLYLRPLMFATQPALGLAASTTYTFMVIASPSDAFATGSLRVLIEREASRAAIGGTGHVKVSGNYGASLRSTTTAMQQGFNQPLWLDAASHRYIEELSVMNFFAVIDGELHTPPLDGTILPGVTRDSVIALARAGGMVVREQPLEIDGLLNLIESAQCTEAFACGTAVIIASISAIGDGKRGIREFEAPTGPVAERLRKDLLDIQEGRAGDRFGWMQSVPKEFYGGGA
jgi:branched-chain amino acid aminotransferase